MDENVLLLDETKINQPVNVPKVILNEIFLSSFKIRRTRRAILLKKINNLKKILVLTLKNWLKPYHTEGFTEGHQQFR